MERGEERDELNNYNLQVSFSSSASAAAGGNNIHELGFVHFADHNLQVMSFLAPSSQSSQISQPLQSPAINTNAAAAAAAAGPSNNVSDGLGFTHNELVINRPSWNNDQVETVDPKAVNDENCSGNASEGNNS
ncbi:hypothetical protein HAX54_021524, partial [Datura stramonium]|nr:hypothetical protein [Datura stramonium]